MVPFGAALTDKLSQALDVNLLHRPLSLSESGGCGPGPARPGPIFPWFLADHPYCLPAISSSTVLDHASLRFSCTHRHRRAVSKFVNSSTLSGKPVMAAKRLY